MFLWSWRICAMIPPLVLCCLCSMGVSALAHEEDFENGYATETSAKERDFQALQDYIDAKRLVSVREKGGSLMISGDVRGEYYKLHSVIDHHFQRGWKSRKRYPNSRRFREAHRAKRAMQQAQRQYMHAHSVRRKLSAQRDFRQAHYRYRIARNDLEPPWATNEFYLQANLIFDYFADRSWGTVQLQMEPPCGLPQKERKLYRNDSRNILYGSGELKEFVLRQCFAGYNLYQDWTIRCDAEIGRRRLYDIFESKVEFNGWFDGVLLRYLQSFEQVADLSVKLGAFVIDYTVNHYGYVGEIAGAYLGGTGISCCYSLIDWNLNRPNRYGKHHPLGTRYQTSQMLVSWDLPEECVAAARLYAACLVNHRAPQTHRSHDERSHRAAYIGGQMGRATSPHDWSFELYYLWIQAQAIPEEDIAWPCRDNPRGISWYNHQWGGFANCRGCCAEFFYVLTDNWTFNARCDRLRELDHRIGGKQRSSELYLSAIFTF